MNSNFKKPFAAQNPIFENSTANSFVPSKDFSDSQESVIGEGEPNSSPEDLVSRMGQAFVNAKKLTQEQVKKIVQLQRRTQVRFGEAAITLGLLTERDVHEVLAQQFNYQTVTKNAVDSRKRISAKLLIAHSPYSAEAEAIRSFRSEILLRIGDKPCVVLALVSPNSKEGKSHLCASLAIAFSQLNMKTLLIDANLRRPAIHQFFDLPNKTGLSTMLAGRTLVTLDLAHHISNNLDVITSGPKPPNPNEILSTPNLSDLLEKFNKEAQVIIIDTPPTRVGSDSQAIAQQAGNAVMLCRKDFTRIAELKDALRDMDNASVKLLGSFYNIIPPGIEQSVDAMTRMLAGLPFHRRMKS